MGTSSNSTSFSQATQEAFSYLQEQTGLQSWTVARIVGKEWVVLRSNDSSSSFEPGTVYPWNDTLCSRMIDQEQSCALPNLDEDPDFCDAPLRKVIPCNAYIGVPVYPSERELFGTLCGLDKKQQTPSITKEIAQVEIMARLLESVLQDELMEGRESRRIEREAARACRDSLTGLYTLPSWDMLLAAEEDRCHRYGHPAVVGSIDILSTNGKGSETNDEELAERTRTAGRVLRRYTRKTDIVAKAENSKFLLLAVESERVGVELIRERLCRAMSYAGLDVAIGLSYREPNSTLLDSQILATEEMRTNSLTPVTYTI